MRGEIIAIDLETTGLDPYTDFIIEIGAVRFKEGEIIETFSTLIDPGIPIPPRISALTSIYDEDVTGAPQISDVVHDLRKFIGNTPLLGHRINFDVSFLSPFSVGLTNILIDTYELASFLLPTAPRYNLTSLTEQLELSDLTNAHRALDDAIATCNLYWALWQKLLQLPLRTLREINTAAINLDWQAKPTVIDALQLRSEKPSTREELADGLDDLGSFEPEDDNWETLRPNQIIEAIDPNELAALIEPGGKMQQFIPNYESRHPQIEMLKSTADAFNGSQHTMIEAPTGTGKSFAYLIPSIYWAVENNERVIISTDTIALQDQLIKKDLPTLRGALDVKFKATVSKGRNNYLCPRRLRTVRRRAPTSIEELRVLAKILVWMLESDSGDKGEISLRGVAEEMTWVRLSAQDEGCTMSRCSSQMEGACPFYKARKRAEESHIVVVNHALLLTDVQVGNRVLPDYRYLVIDEAHHLEEATTNGLSHRLDASGLHRRFADLGNIQKGLLSDLLAAVQNSIPKEFYMQIRAYVEHVSEAVGNMENHVDEYFRMLLNFLHNENLIQKGEYISHIRITEELRETVGWQEILTVWKRFSEYTEAISSAMEKVTRGLNDLRDYDIPDYSDLLNSTQTAARHLKSIHNQLEAFTKNPQENMVYWCEVSTKGTHVSVNAAPLHVGPLIEEHLWQPKECVILTSATLTTAGSFNFMRDRLDAFDDVVAEFMVDTPFDYENSTLLYLPTDIPEPNSYPHYQNMIERGIIELATALDGRLLGLFTSYAQLRQAAQSIEPRLALGGISVLDQSSGSSRQLLIDSFKSTEKAVLLGTRSFWEGVDLPGDDLQAVVITRLPFAVPSDPVFAARSETFENSFLQYAVPDAILRFRQGFGRLIRRRTDRGVVVILDKRVTTKRYGRAFLESLPHCTVRRGPLSKLADAAKEWVDR